VVLTTIEADRDEADGARPTPRRRGGRPPASHAGEVDGRILDAASRLFLDRGLEGTSCDHVAVLARAGKASIYARYANKEALFIAVIKRDAEQSLAVTDRVPTDLPLGDRLLAVGTSMIEHVLRPSAVALMRVTIAEGARFPDLASHVDAIWREGGVRRVAEVIACRSPSAEAIAQATAPAAQFVDLVVPPMLMRALLGDDVATLRTRAPRQVETATAMLAATGWLDGWS